MGKSNGSTRAGNSGNPRGLSGGRYQTYIDEDTGESVSVFVPNRSREERALTTEYNRDVRNLEKELGKQEREQAKQRDLILSLRDDVRNLNNQRKALLSDMEDELSRNETPQRRDWYGRKLNKLDSQIEIKRTQYTTANVNYNTASDRIKRISEQLDSRRAQYQEQLKKLR